MVAAQWRGGRVKEAKYRPSRWMGWVWAVPIAALGVVLWLGIRTLTQGGPEVVVTFAEAGSVKAGDTKVTYKDMEVGQVESVTLQKDLKAVDVRLSFHANMDGHLGPGTRFWITGQTLQLGDISSIRSLIAGPKIEVDPRPGRTQHHVRGLDEPPVLKREPAGTQFVLHATHLGSISRGSPIYYRDLKVGEVQGYKFVPPDSFDIYAFVAAPYAKLVHDGSRFWDASAAQIAMNSSGPSFRLQSPMALITGAVAFETPQGDVGPVARPDAEFTLYDNEDRAQNSPATNAVAYRVTLNDAAAAGLEEGAPVRLEGRRIGSVVGNELRFAPDRDQLVSDVTIAINPRSLLIANAPEGGGRKVMDTVLGRMVAAGLRAQLGSNIPVVGGKDIELHFVPGVQEASLIAGSPPAIPTTPGGDITQAIRQVSEVASKIDAMPLSGIAQDIHATTQRLAQLSNSPQLQESLQRLDRSVGNIEEITTQARTRIGPLLAQLRQMAEQASAAVASARALINGQGVGGPAEAGLPQALDELTRAARSLRELADLLDRHPEALLSGKPVRP
jgi:paraquat-inducible protein B